MVGPHGSTPALVCSRVEEGVRKEPFEELMCEVEEDHTGAVIEAVTLRKGEVRRRREPLSHLLK
jgi:predicted membrane GTPase involved in stress response